MLSPRAVGWDARPVKCRSIKNAGGVTVHRAEVRNGYVYVIDTTTGSEKQINTERGVTRAEVTDDDELTITYDMYGGTEVRYRISTGNRA